MADSIDYSSVEIPEDEEPENYHYTARRAEILKRIECAGSPARINQTELADRYDVAQSQISQDLDALGEFVDEALGQRAKLTTRSLFRRVVDELLEEDDWRAKAKAFDIVMEWNGWLADVGEQHREPDKSELDVEMESQTREVSYTVVRDAEDIDGGLLTDAADPADGTDYEDLGFTKAPTSIAVTDPHEEDG